MLDPSGGPSAPGRRFNGERGAPLRYAPTPHSPQGRSYGFPTQKECLMVTDESIDELIVIKGIFTFPTYHCQGACMNGTHAKSEVLKVKWWRENVFPRKSTFSVPVCALLSPTHSGSGGLGFGISRVCLGYTFQSTSASKYSAPVKKGGGEAEPPTPPHAHRHPLRTHPAQTRHL